MFMDGADKLGGGFTTHLKPMAEGGVLVYISVDDIEAMLSKITANGGRAVQPRTEISPEVGWWASFHDPAGNLMGLYQKRR
jgi:predicted enzyme related to lactoylglutathione lyase